VRPDRDLAWQAGFDEHLVKPVDLSTLQRVLGAERAAP
jgi:CheY-like chemotaxis protein